MGPWSWITYVSSGFSLIAFIVASAAWMIREQAKKKLELIKAATDDRKADLVDKALDRVSVDTANLTRQQKYDLAMELIRRRSERFLVTAIVICFLAVVGCGTAIYSGTRIPPDSKSPLAPFIQEHSHLHSKAAGMAFGPLDKVREVSSEAPKLAKDILDISNITKPSYKMDQRRYAASAYLFAADAAGSREKRIEYAKKSIELAEESLKLVSTAKSTDAELSRILSKMNYEEKLRQIIMGACLTLVNSGDSNYEQKYNVIKAEMDPEYYRENLGDNFEVQKKEFLDTIEKLWESG